MIIKKYFLLSISLCSFVTFQTLSPLTVSLQNTIFNQRFLRHFIAKSRKAKKIYIITYDLGVAAAINTLISAKKRNVDIKILIGTSDEDAINNHPYVQYGRSFDISIQTFLDMNTDHEGISCYFENDIIQIILNSSINLSTYEDLEPVNYILSSDSDLIDAFLQQFNVLWTI